MSLAHVKLKQFKKAPSAGVMLHKRAGTGETEVVGPAIDAEKRQATFICSDGSIDRHGDTINPAGWKLDGFLKNGPLLFGHDSWSLPIGQCVKIWVEDGQLKGTFQFAKSEAAEEVWQLVLDGTLKAVSVGFKPVKWVENGERVGRWGMPATDFLEQELLEVSMVSIGANANAVLASKGLAGAVAKSLLERMAKDDGEEPDGDEADPMEGLDEKLAMLDQRCQRLEAVAARIESACTRLEGLAEPGEDEPAPEDGDKATQPNATKGASHQLSKAVEKHLCEAEKALGNIRSYHESGKPTDGDAEPDDDEGKPSEGDDGDEGKNLSPLERWLRDVKQAGGDPKAALEAEAKVTAARATGRID